MTELNSSQKDFIYYSGMLGIGLGLACLFQQLYIIGTDPVYALLFSLSAITGIIAYSYLLLHKKDSGLLLIIASALLFLRQAAIAWLLVKYGIVMFSLIQLVFLVYTIVITILFFANEYPPVLKKIAVEKKAEREYWRNNEI